MANINLNNYYRRANEQHSAVDSTLVTRHDNADTETYSDIKFDLKIKQISERSLNATENDNDIQKITDVDSVINSLKNIFHTLGCTRLLNPEMDIGLLGFLFEPINEHTAYFIGYTIKTMIPAYEPRVKLQNISVIGNPDAGEYEITITAFIPALNKYIDVSAVLEEETLSLT